MLLTKLFVPLVSSLSHGFGHGVGQISFVESKVTSPESLNSPPSNYLSSSAVIEAKSTVGRTLIGGPHLDLDLNQWGPSCPTRLRSRRSWVLHRQFLCRTRRSIMLIKILERKPRRANRRPQQATDYYAGFQNSLPINLIKNGFDFVLNCSPYLVNCVRC